ncbi:MAG: carboxypeptidase-like regulatory domain-containing protein [Planctomycetota bacterium]|jgi:hypothetical protein
MPSRRVNDEDLLYRLAARRLREDDSVPPPPEVAARAKALFDRAPVRAPGWIDQVEAIVARLIFDSRVQPIPVRAGAATGRIQLAFEADGVDIDLAAEPVEGSSGAQPGWSVMGQIAADVSVDDVGVTLRATGKSEPVAETRTNEHGAFQFNHVPAGDYEMQITLPPVIQIPDLQLR